MKVGDKVWLFSSNRRVYIKDGKHQGSPVYSEHFFDRTITGETSRSWIVDDRKYSKKNPNGLYTDQQKEDAIWREENIRKIINLVDSCSTETLRKIQSTMQQ